MLRHHGRNGERTTRLRGYEILQIHVGENRYLLLFHLLSASRSQILPVDDSSHERVQGDIQKAQGLGTIRVDVHHSLDLGRRSNRGSFRHQFGDSNSESLEIAEKSLKGQAVSHGTSYVSLELLRLLRCPLTSCVLQLHRRSFAEDKKVLRKQRPK
jgi:hypothetical protein